MSCIRDPDRLAAHHGHSRIAGADADTRPSPVSAEPLRDWLDDRLHRGDITYHATVNGIDIYRILRPLYGENYAETDEG